jgi:hypothetical protein
LKTASQSPARKTATSKRHQAGSAGIVARAGADSNKIVITILVIRLVSEVAVMWLVKALLPGWQNIFAHLTGILFMAIRRQKCIGALFDLMSWAFAGE